MKILLTILLLCSVIIGNTQETDKKSRKELKAEKKEKQIEETKNLLDSKTFVFDVTTVNPMQGRTINVTSNYNVKIQNDSIYCYLPYFGRAYTASLGADSPMIFDKTIDEYSMEKTKKGMYVVQLKTKNKQDVLEFTFHIGETGSASLMVNSSNRQSISYYGNLEETTEDTAKNRKTKN